MKLSTIISTLLILVSCSNLRDGLTRERIVFPKKLLGYRTSYSIKVPELENIEKEISLIWGGHGHGFNIVFSDSSMIYYDNDDATSTPNARNYETVKWKGFSIFNPIQDTVLHGQQENGLYWKEVKKGEDYIGYLNVPASEKELFDQSIETFKK